VDTWSVSWWYDTADHKNGWDRPCRPFSAPERRRSDPHHTLTSKPALSPPFATRERTVPPRP